MRKLTIIVLLFLCTYLHAQTTSIRKIGTNVGIGTNFIYDLAQDKDDAILIATDIGLYRFNGTFAKTIVTNVFFRKVKVYRDKIFALTNSGEIFVIKDFKIIKKYKFQIDNLNDFVLVGNDLWLTNGNQLFRSINFKKPTEINHRYGFLEGFFVKHSTTYAYTKQECIALTKQGITYMESFKNILSVSDGNGFNTSIFTQNDFDQLEFGSNIIDFKGITIDGASKLTIVDGVVQLHSSNSKYVLQNPELKGNMPNILFLDKEGGVWICEKGKEMLYLPFPKVLTFEGKVSREDWKLETLKFYTNQSLSAKPIGNIQDYDLSHDETWILGQNGVFVYKNGILKQISKQTGTQIAYNSLEKTVYIATYSEGIVSMSITGSVLKNFSIANGLSHHIIHDLKMVNSQLYILTEGGGIDLIKNGKLTNHSNNDEFKKGIFTSIVYNKNLKTVAIASPNLGIYLNTNDSKDWTFIPFSQLIYSIFERENQLWVLHDKGVDVFAQNQVFNFYRQTDASNSFPVSTFVCQNANQIKLHLYNGSLQFVKPILYSKPSEGTIQNLRFNDKTFEIQNKPLPYGKYRIRFEYDRVDLKSNEIKQVFYRVIGYDQRWKPIESNNVELINITNGKYIVQFKTNERLIKQEFSFEIESPIWLKWWFLLATIVLLFFAVYGIVEWRIRHLRLEKIQLERIIRKRTLQINQKNADLEQYAFSVSHDFKNPVVNISQLTSLVRSGNLPPEDANEALSHIQNTADNLHKNLLGMLQLLQVDGNSQTTERLFLPDIIKHIQANLKSQIENSQTTIELRNMARFVESNPSYLNSIFYNLISNAIKYQSLASPIIEIIGTDTEKGFQVEVKDNGLGLSSDDQLIQLFQPFVRIHIQGEGTGIGLSLILKMARSLNIKLSAKRNSDQGLCFILLFEK